MTTVSATDFGRLLSSLHRFVTLDAILKATGLVGLLVVIKQLRAQQQANVIGQRAHVVGVYRNVFEMMDKPHIRQARRFLYAYAVNRASVSADLNLDENMKSKVEELVRAFDQLGLLVREGQVPVDIVARFYASPAMRCWYILTPYVLAERESRGQPGHLWEWENLVRRVIIPSLNQGGIWSGVASHDSLGEWAKKIDQDAQGDNFKRWSDEEYSPGAHLWQIER